MNKNTTSLLLAMVSLLAIGRLQSQDLAPSAEVPASGGRAASADEPRLELGSPFVNDMILQRGMPVPVWGWEAPGSTVTVSFAEQTKSCTVGAEGEWILRLDPLTASSVPQSLTVGSSHGVQRTVTITGVLVGEVWFASGQSNMDWIAGKSMCRKLADELSRRRDEVPIREYQVDIGSALFPQRRTTAEGGWRRSRHASGFSALALAFAAELHRELDVPIGILRSTHGATPIETWTPYEGFAAQPTLQHIALKIRQSDPRTRDGARAYEAYYQDLRRWQQDSEAQIARGGTALPRPPLPGIADEWKGASRMHNMKVAPLIPYAIRGVIWCQGTHNADDGKIYAAKMKALVDGWRAAWGRPELPFYFTQMQCYGEPNPDTVGFADLREAQRRFFMNAHHVGMVPQYDLNPERPSAIHNVNKLDPGKRLARWALAQEYGKDIAYCGPLYASHAIEGSTVRVRFEHRGPGGGLMVGSKGMEADWNKQPEAYVEPARETPGEPLRHFRLAGKDRVWHSAQAVIEDDEVVVTSPAVPEPVGVQYAYSTSPIGANLYSRAGLPATPFASFAGEPLFQEDLPEAMAERAAREAARKNPPPRTPYLQPSTLLRHRAVLQRDRPVPVWGHALPGSEVTVSFAGQTKTTVVGEFDLWRVTLDPLSASPQGRPLTIACSQGPSTTIEDVVVGDVWFLTGTTRLSGELVTTSRGRADERSAPPQPMPLLREFRIKTNARRFRTPRKQRMEIGGGRYESHWRPALFASPDDDTSVAAHAFALGAQEEGVPIGVITLGADNPPLTWMSYEGVQNAAGFETERDELNLLYPNTEACKLAIERYIETLKRYTREIVALDEAGEAIPRALSESPPPFPEPFYDAWSNETETACQTYNFCIAPLTPCAVRGVVWIPGPKNLGKEPACYTPAIEAYAASLARTYGQPEVAFLCAQPASALMNGARLPRIAEDARVTFTTWDESIRRLAAHLGELAPRKR
ncbi:MAG: hypothetical protein H6834_18065 [Planctomycetes bacterium]|nr:hypothetical protein [Planctomycetota bacterium]